ncbi:BirA family biotin operon repressor/biotin-[acetyl-CoA-carboxylase] ligase [Homoserinimonas aerilata]|uniref:BirA family biotin operon repressor/biotin-[acetyl-CoA-carboxylase] ligase n=1 Tax=Homoserinimonas aerilata TaxID=1162970 RepID=A0A542YKU1_9MICO|nr:biotin--[acetyl-CoA-carboxylase] ligase [Homoserinimonas aerilata]TQL48671.1 BirA family biotin operon repressor/biotin-[acetyl-CoA-carboxylase] ligase [Homoserinimonas aerilata]
MRGAGGCAGPAERGRYAGRMLLPLSTPHATRLEALAECGSTNTVLVAHAAEGWPEFSVVVTDNQTGGRGRLGRSWVAPAGQTLAVSVLLRPTFSLEAFGWLPLIAGVAMARAVREVLASASEAAPESKAESKASESKAESVASEAAAGLRPLVTLKWPNDVLIGVRDADAGRTEKKVSGLLAELVPSPGSGAPAVVLGAGLNLTIPADGLPVDTATSLTLHGADADGLPDRALSAYLRELRALYGLLQQHDGDADASGIRRMVSEECATLGRSVRIQLPGGGSETARAVELDTAGQLVVRRARDGALQSVAAGDVTHLRYE